MQIRMPVGAVTSIAHRVSGVLLALGVPFSAYIFDLSLQGPRSFERAQELLAGSMLKAAAIVFVWALAHHLLAGVRHLLSDIGVGSRLPFARRSAWVVNGTGVFIALLAAWALL
ncbi:Succinate dehydrogenase cytochrome b556 subunit [Variovorax sp. PBL-E5]|nr:Succinate dehydrogenase cytochrome b556 subunit [Variovorax sp. PBL-E5]